MKHASREELLLKIEELENRLAESEQLVDAIKAGEVDAFAVTSNDQSEVYTLQSGDYAYRVLIEKFGEGALNLTEEGLIVYTNSYFFELLDLPYEAVVGSYIFSLVHQDSKEIFNRLFGQALTGNSKGEINLSVNDKKIPVYISLTSLRPRLETVGVVITDLTEKKRQEDLISQKSEELENARSFLQSVFDASVEQIVTLDRNLAFTSINKKAAEFLGRPKEKILGRSLYELIPNIRGSQAEKDILTALSGEPVHEKQIPSTFKEGAFLETYYIPLVRNNTVEGVMSINKDISPIVFTAEQLKQANQQLAQAQQMAHIGSWEWDVIQNEITWSDELYAIYGLDKGRFENSYENYLNSIHPGDRQLVDDLIKASYESHEPFSFYHRLVRPDGEVRILHGRGEVFCNEAGVVSKMTGTAQDVTEIKEAEEQLLQANKQLSETRDFLNSILESTNHGVLSYRAIRENGQVVDFEIAYANEIALEQIELPAQSVLGKRYLDLFPFAKERGLFDRLVRVITSGVSESVEMSGILHPERWFIAQYVPLENAVTATFIEITEQKRQARILQEKNMELERSNAELASFSYIASHDLQEPLRKIQTFSGRILELAHEQFPDNIKDYFQRIIYAASRMQNLIEDILSYSRTNTSGSNYVPTDLNEILEEVKGTLCELIGETGAEIRAEKLPVLKVIPLQVGQLFSNLLSNALKYRKAGVSPVITISAGIVPAGELQMEEAFASDEYWKITFADNGIGFEQQYADKIFELFQRLHVRFEYEGTGIGLAICKKIIQNHGGYINAIGKPGEGSSFSVYLPVEKTAS